MGATIKDIAQYCNLSISTISKYINGGIVRKKNEKKIQEAIELLQYNVNEIARGLKTKRSRTIGILVPDLKHAFFGSLVSIIERKLAPHGYSVIVCSYQDDNPDEERNKLRFLINKLVDGVLLVPKYIRRIDLVGMMIPIILIDRLIEDYLGDAVIIDNREATKRATQAIINANHTRIGFVTGNDEVYTFKERLQGYYQAHDESMIPLNSELIRTGVDSIEGGYSMMNALLALRNRPTAVFAANADLSLGVLISIRDNNISIPEEISFMGFDNEDLSRGYKPALSIVHQPVEEICASVVSTLLRRLSGDLSDFPLKTVLRAHLSIEDSISVNMQAV